MLEDEDVFYVTFKGTDNLFEMIIDLDVLLTRFCGLQVHNGMAGALQHEQAGGMSVLEELRTMAYTFGAQGKPVILTGHSLGGGYALLAGLYLLEHGCADVVSQAVTFGAPQVMVPNVESRSCQQLERITTLYVRLACYLFFKPFWERRFQLTGIFGKASNHQLIIVAHERGITPLLLRGFVCRRILTKHQSD